MKRRTILSLLLFTLFLFAFLPSDKSYAETKTAQKPASLERPVLDDQGTLTLNELETPKLSRTYSSDWDKYATYYFYNQLNQSERNFYDYLNSICRSFMDGTRNATKIRLTSGIELDTISYLKVSGLSLDNALNVAQIFYYSNPQYYFLRPYFPYGYMNGNYYISIGVYPDFANGNNRSKATAAMKSKIQSYVDQINRENGIVAKEKKAHDLIVNSVTYEENTYDQSVYSAFITGKTVCTGYAGAFSILCNAVNIDTAMVTSSDHAYNIIRLNDSWYYVDCTWDDLDGTYDIDYVYLFFNRNRDKMRTLLPEQADQHVEESLWKYYLPSCTFDSGATTLSIGTIHSPSGGTQAPVIHADHQTDYTKVTLSSSTPGAIIYYTLNNGTPSAANSICYRYTKPFTVTSATKVQAVAVCNGYADSWISSSNVTINKRRIALCQITGLSNKTFNNKSQKQSLCLKWNGQKLTYGKDYTLTYSDNKAIGRATVVIRGKGDYYYGQKTLHFTISPKKASLTKLTAKRRSAKFTWKKDSSVQGYQIQYSTSKNFHKKSTVTIKNAKTTSYTANRLRSKTKYYVRIRCYKKSSGKTYYSSYSKTLSVRVR